MLPCALGPRRYNVNAKLHSNSTGFRENRTANHFSQGHQSWHESAQMPQFSSETESMPP